MALSDRDRPRQKTRPRRFDGEDEIESMVGESSPVSVKPRKRRIEGLFIMGPIPWVWIEHAGALPGKALLAGMYIWQQAGMKTSKAARGVGRYESVRFSYRKMGLPESTARRALAALEDAGLVVVERHPGRCPMVTLIEVADSGRHQVDDKSDQDRQAPEDLSDRVGAGTERRRPSTIPRRQDAKRRGRVKPRRRPLLPRT